MVRSPGRAEKAFDVLVWVGLTIAALAAIVPLWYVVALSVTPFPLWSRTGGSLFVAPSAMTFAGYEQLLTSWRVPRAFGVSVGVTVVGTALNLLVTTLMAYPLSRKGFRLRTPLLLLVLFTMLFNGGLVPTYLIVRELNLLDSYWALMLPNLVSAFNLLVMKTFFEHLPPEVLDAAKVDGASDWRVLGDVVLPLSRPLLATVGLFYAVGHWNGFLEAVLYISSPEKQPLQVVLREILAAGNVNEYVEMNVRQAMPIQSVRMAAVVITVVPMLLVYPFLQRHFTQGMLVGSVKG